MPDRNFLFNRFPLWDTLDGLPDQVRSKIHNESRDYILNVNEEEYRSHLEAEFRIEPLQLGHDNIEVVKQFEKTISVKEYDQGFQRTGTFITFAIPFTGERELFFQKPSTSSTISPRGEVTKTNELLLTFEDRGDADVIRAELDKAVATIDQHIAWQRTQILAWNNSLAGLIAQEFKSRKYKFLQDVGVLGKLGLPLRKRADVPETFAVPVKKKLGIDRPSASAKPEPYQAHSVITQEAYEEILAAMRKMALTMERSPSAYEKMGEEDLRMLFLVTLNGAFEADATGETFNFGGKTDILLRREGRNLFIAECKFWAGPKQFLKTIDQLLNYLTWRDCRAAILVFVRDTSMATVLEKVPETLARHPNFQRSIDSTGSDEFRAKMKSARDKALSLDLAVQVYHVPNKDSEDAGGKGG